MTACISGLPPDIQKELRCIAETLVSPGKGILAADESIAAMGKRLKEVGLQNDEEIRRRWRELLFSTDREIGQYISGVILSVETLCQQDNAGKPLIDYLKERCLIPGVKVDGGLVNLETSEDEVVTQGLDDLGNRLQQFKAEGCEFARWRCVYKIGVHTPSYQALISNAETIARFATICQSKRMCPLIEPQILPEGNHDIAHCQRVTETVLNFVYRALNDHHVFLEGTILKVSMVASGMSQIRDTPAEIGLATVTALRRSVPPAVPGICFSSDGQPAEEATANLNAIVQNKCAKPWRLTFAFGRALQTSALRCWQGRPENKKRAQDEYMKRAKANSNALTGQCPDVNQPENPIPIYIASGSGKTLNTPCEQMTTPSITGAKWFDFLKGTSVTDNSLSGIPSTIPQSTSSSVSEVSNSQPESVTSVLSKDSKVADRNNFCASKSQSEDTIEPVTGTTYSTDCFKVLKCTMDDTKPPECVHLEEQASTDEVNSDQDTVSKSTTV